MENSVWQLIQDLSTKQGISEIVINDPKRVFVERQGQFIQLNVSISKKDIYDFAKEVALFNKKEFDALNPILDGSLPDGSRVNVISEPYCQGSPAVTIRRYSKSIRSFDDDNKDCRRGWFVVLLAIFSAMHSSSKSCKIFFTAFN